MPTRKQLIIAADALFTDLGTNAPPAALLSHFSTSSPISVCHTPSACPLPQTASRLVGYNAVRSYFDLLALHWDRSDPQRHSITAFVDPPEGGVAGRCQVIIKATVRWTWKASGRSWEEEFTATLDYDESVKVVNFTVKTDSATGTCVMRAVDRELDEIIKSGEVVEWPVGSKSQAHPPPPSLRDSTNIGTGARDRNSDSYAMSIEGESIEKQFEATWEERNREWELGSRAWAVYP